MDKKKQLPPSKKSPPDSPVALQVFKAEGFSGPLPPPHLLAEYNEAFPGCAERIVAMAETQAKHRQELERKVVFSNSHHEMFGQISALIIALSSIGASTYLTLKIIPGDAYVETTLRTASFQLWWAARRINDRFGLGFDADLDNLKPEMLVLFEQKREARKLRRRKKALP